jgi:hypothetical protein
MNQDSQNFDSLRQLLALKRHEVPPPGYYDRLSRDVMARIKAGDTGNELGADRSWFRRFLNVFDVKPVFAGAFGTAVCAFLISGVITSERTPAFAAGTSLPVDPTLTDASGATTADASFMASSNSVPTSSLFGNLQSLHATPATWLRPEIEE